VSRNDVAAVLTTVMTDVAFHRLAGSARLGWGPKVALLGGVMVFAGAWAPDVVRRLSTGRRPRASAQSEA